MGGKIITIEGLDGAGKSTQIELLIRKLREMGVPHQFIHFPMLNAGYYGQLIAEYLRGELGALDEVHPKLVALLFAEDRKEHRNRLEDWLRDGQLVIMDRYVHSNIAYQCAKTSGEANKEALKNWILDFEFNHNALPKPEASFFLHVPFPYIERSLAADREGGDRAYLNGKTDIHEASLDLQRNVYAEYQKLLVQEKEFREIACFGPEGDWLPPTSIHEAIWAQVAPLLSTR